MSNHAKECQEFDELMYEFPQSFLSRKYTFICITPDMLRTGVNFDKFCDYVGYKCLNLSTKLSSDNTKGGLLENSEIKINFDLTSYFAYTQNPDVQTDFMYFLMETLKPEYLLDVPYGQKRKKYFNG